MSDTAKPAAGSKYRPRRKPRAPLPVVYIEAGGTTTLAELVARANAPSPDAQMVAACDRLLFLIEEKHELYRLAEPGYLELVRASIDEQRRLRAEIAAAHPSTHAGRRARAEVAVADLISTGGIYGKVAEAALRDFMRADGGAE